jgi:uncharacterized protein (TIGR02231 family)
MVRMLRNSICLLALMGPECLAAEFTVTPQIDAVTLYLSGATIKRKGVVSLPVGEHVVLVKGLPADLDPDVARVAFASKSIDIGSVEFQRNAHIELVSETEKLQQRKVEAIQQQIAAVNDEMQTAQLQLRIIESLAASQNNSTRDPAITGANLSAALASAGTGSETARTKVRDATRRLQGLQNELGAATTELNKVRSGNRATTEAKITVRVKAPVENIGITLDYQTDSASWNPSYSARVDSATHKVDLVEQANVSQSSGEAWTNVSLTLSSAKPSDDLQGPGLESIFLDIEKPEPPPPPPVMSAPAPVAQGRYKESEDVQDIVVTARRVDSADIVARGYVVDYKIPGRLTIQSDREPRLFPITEQAWDVDLRATVIPSVDHAAYVYATFKNDRDTPIRGGDLQVYRDGAFVGQTKLATVLPGDEARLPVGADERIRVSIRPEEEKSRKPGSFERSIVRETRLRYEITSFHAEPVTVDVIDRLPVPRNKDVEVQFLTGYTAPTEKNYQGKEGILLWRLLLAPQQMQSVRHAYSVKYPKGYLLNEDESDPGVEN